MSTQLLRLELMKKLRRAYPNHPIDRLEQMAQQIESTHAYSHDGERILPSGTRQQLNKASQIAPLVCGAISQEFVDAVAPRGNNSSNPLDRAEARLRSMGIDMDSALNESEGPMSFDDWDLGGDAA